MTLARCCALSLTAALLAACAGVAPRPDAGLASDAAAPPAPEAAPPSVPPEPAAAPAEAVAAAEPRAPGAAVASAATQVAADDDDEESAEVTAARARIVAEARRMLGKAVKLDCSGYVLAAYRAAGLALLPLPAAARSIGLFQASARIHRPRPGDLAFFHDTYDRNRNGKVDDGITHVALVESVDGDVVTLLHRGKRVERIHMDLAEPGEPRTNDPVRVQRTRDRRGTHYLSGQLFAAYGALLDGPFTQMLQASPAPDTGAGQASRRWSPTIQASTKVPRRSSSTARRASSSSARAAGSSASSRSTRRSSSRSSATGTRSARSRPAP